MQSSLIGKIEKAKRYAQEKDRIRIKEITAEFHGDNDNHTIIFHNGDWHCNCHFFASWGRCSHTMALETILIPMLPQDSLSSGLD
jgi:hypothetical protein